MFDPEKYFEEKLELLRTSRKIQKRIILVVIFLLLGLAAKFAYELMPRHYNLSLTGGGLLSNRHHLAKILSEEANKYHNLSIRVTPTSGSIQAMELVDAGKLDLALIQGGLDSSYENVRHVATISPELIHILVKPGIESISDIRGKVVNMGSLVGGTRIVAKQIFALSGLKNGVDYIETNFSERDLIEMRAERLPDVIILISYAPSDVVEIMVKKYGYGLMEIPFPPSLAIRLGWVSDAKILGYMYSISPAVPPKDIQVIGVNLHLVANKNVEPRAVAALIETLYGPHVANRFGQSIPEANLLLPSGFPLSSGTQLYLSRKEPLLTQALIDKVKALFGLLMTIGSTLLVLYKWFTMEKKDESGQAENKPEIMPDSNPEVNSELKPEVKPAEKEGVNKEATNKEATSAKEPKKENILDKLSEANDHIKKLSD